MNKEKYDMELFWSRRPGTFVDKRTGKLAFLHTSLDDSPVFTGKTIEWYETLVETIFDLAGSLMKMFDLNFYDIQLSENDERMLLFVNSEILTMMECSYYYRGNYNPTNEDKKNKKAGVLRSHIDVFYDKSLPKNVATLKFRDKLGKLNVLDMNLI